MGLNKLPGELRRVSSFVPQKVDAGLRGLLSNVATKLRSPTSSVSDDIFKGMVATRKDFAYNSPTQTPNYTIVAVQSGTTVKVKLAEKVVNGQWKILADLKESSFTTMAANGDYDGQLPHYRLLQIIFAPPPKFSSRSFECGRYHVRLFRPVGMQGLGSFGIC